MRDQATTALVSVTQEAAVVPPNQVELSGCWHCAGRGFIRLELEPGMNGFGQAVRCPACLGGDRVCPCGWCTADAN